MLISPIHRFALQSSQEEAQHMLSKILAQKSRSQQFLLTLQHHDVGSTMLTRFEAHAQIMEKAFQTYSFKGQLGCPSCVSASAKSIWATFWQRFLQKSRRKTNFKATSSIDVPRSAEVGPETHLDRLDL